MSAEIQKILQLHKKFTNERNWDRFQTPKNLSMALSVEVSELVEIFMWLSEEQAASLNAVQKRAASEEIADIFIYLVRIAHLLDIDIITSAEKKMAKNNERFPVAS